MIFEIKCFYENIQYLTIFSGNFFYRKLGNIKNHDYFSYQQKFSKCIFNFSFSFFTFFSIFRSITSCSVKSGCFMLILNRKPIHYLCEAGNTVYSFLLKKTFPVEQTSKFWYLFFYFSRKSILS